ncbi:MAG: nicotinamide riboside transporter PnuC [Candidatus Woesearchaeota archaeon]
MVSHEQAHRAIGTRKLGLSGPIAGFFADWTLFEKAWLIGFSLITIALTFAWNDSFIGLIASLTGMICVVLVAKARISNYYFGLVNVILYAWIAWQSSYYGEVMLNLLFYVPVQILGLILWRRHSTRADVVAVRWLSHRERIVWFSIAIFATAGYGLVLSLLKGTLPFVDATSTVFSVVAMILMILRVPDQWVLWIGVNIISIIMWTHILVIDGTGVSMIVMWSAYLVNSVYGLVNWRRIANGSIARAR